MNPGIDHYPRRATALTVGSAFIGMMLSATILPFYSLGPLIKPLHHEFGWSNLGLSACLSALAAGVTL